MNKFWKKLDDVSGSIIGWLILIPIILDILLVPVTLALGCIWLLVKMCGG